MRLDAACSLALGLSRRESREEIRRGRVTVDGTVEKRADLPVGAGNRVSCGGVELDLREHLYFMLSKPAGTVCTTEDTAESVLRLFPSQYRRRLFCVGRLDKDTTGLLFLTDDGEFDHRLMSPKHHAEKQYAVTLARPLDPDAVARLEGGMTLENGEVTLPCRVDPGDGIRCSVILREGKYHQVKRMFAAVGNRVVALSRVSVGGVRLDPSLAPGAWRELTAQELALLGTD